VYGALLGLATQPYSIALGMATRSHTQHLWTQDPKWL